MPKIGKRYYIRTPLYHWIGVVRDFDPVTGMLTLDDAAWIAEGARYSVMIANGLKDNDECEVEYVGDDVEISINGADAVPYPHPTPKTR